MKGAEHIEWLQNSNKKETHPVCLHAAEMYEMMESVNGKNDYKTASKK